MLACPNKSHPDWVYSVEKLGEDKTLFLYDLLGQELPTKEQVDSVVEGKPTILKESKDDFISRTTARIENGMYKDKSGKLIPITDSFNPNVWQVENDEGLVSMNKGIRDEKLFKFDEGKQKAGELNSKYKGFRFVIEQVVFPKQGIVKVKNPAPNSRKIYRIKVTQVSSTLLPSSIISELDITTAMNSTEQMVADTFERLENKTIQETIDIVNNLEIDDNLKLLLNLFSSKLDATPNLKIVIDNNDNTYNGDYDASTNVITLYSRSHLEGATVNLNNIGVTLVHELLHAFTTRALYNKFSEKEKEFATTIERLYSIAKKQTKYKNTTAYTDSNEWLANILTRPFLKKEVMNMKLNIWQRILLGIKKLLNITSVYDQALKTVLEYTAKATIVVPSVNFELKYRRSLDKDVYLNKDNVTHKQIWETLNGFSNEFDFDPVTHTYTHIQSGQEFNSVTEMMTRIRITSGKLSEDLEVRERQLKSRERGANIGHVIHGVTEANLKQIAIDIAGSNGYTYDPIVVTKIEQILKQFKRPGVTILSEVLVADVDRLLAGTIDMVIIDENNQVHIYDFKSKEKGFADYLKQTRFGGSQLMSDKERHAFQISAYKDMFEKMTGLNVADLNIVTLKPTVSKDNVVTDINLDKTHSSTGIVTVDYNYGVNALYGILNIDQGKSITNEFADDKVDPELRKELDDKLKEQVKNLTANLDDLSAKEQIVAKSINALIYKKQISYRSGKKQEIASKEKLIEELLDLQAKGEVEKALIKILEFANSSSLRIYNEYKKYTKEGKTLPLNILYGWRDSVSAFDAILNEEDGLLILLNKEFGFKDGPNYKTLLKNTIDIVNTVKSLYESEGLEQLVDFLAPFYNRIYAEKRLAKIKEYRRKKFKGEVKDITESQYVENYINENEETLQEETKTLMRKELKKASRDIGLLTRWIDNLLDTKDPVTAAMVKAFVFTDEDARLGALEKRDEMVSLVREVEEWYKKQGRVPKSNEEFYGFALEKMDGKLTGHLITSYTSDMMTEYRNIVSASKDLETSEQRKTFIQGWLEDNMPLDKVSFQTAYWRFIEEQNSLGHISDEEFTRLEQNNLYADIKLSVGEMTEKGIITFETGSILGSWLSENTWSFRNPIDKWANPQWKTLSKILEDKNDPRGKLYSYIIKLRREADSFLPFGFRLDTRLPGVIKQNHERIDSGQGVGATIRGALSRQLTFKIDDTSRIHEELVDEANNAKYFLPIHFTGRITKEVTKVNSEGEEYTTREFDADEQSFDLATIYHKYWAMANDYNKKARILPQMELTKFMINKREAIKRDSMGNTLLSKVQGNIPPKESTINNTMLAAQVNDWFLSCVYGVQEKDAGTWGKIDVAKLLNFINSYTSLNLLGMNVVAGTANVILGETLQRIESFAGEYMSPKDFMYADKFYLRTMKGMIGDIGARDTSGLGTHIIEQFGVFDEYGQVDMDRQTKMGQLFSMNTLYATSHLGEHYMQSRFLFGLLANKRAFNIKGEDIGRMLDMYELKDNKLVLKKEVDLIKSRWTENDQKNFKLKTRGILSRLHGEYSALGKVAIQRMAIGRMAYLFRHFIVTGFRRRWGKNDYIERLGQFAEGNYITTGKFIGALGGKVFGKTEENKEDAFFSRLISNLQSLKLSMFSEEWASLTDHEKANVHRTIYEVGFLILAIVMANIAMSFKGDADDDDDELAGGFWSFVSYQTYRLQNELLFFSPNLTSSMSILRSPAASMSVIENIIKLTGQITNPTDVYESGAWKGRPKILKTLMDMTPIEKQYYRLIDIETQISWMQKSGFGGKSKDETTTP